MAQPDDIKDANGCARVMYGWGFVFTAIFGITSTIMVVRYQDAFEHDSVTWALAVTNCALLLAASFFLITGCVIAQCPTRTCHNALMCVFMWVIMPVATTATICADILAARIGNMPHDPNPQHHYPPDLPQPTPIPFHAEPYEYYAWTAANAIISSIVVFLTVICTVPCYVSLICGVCEDQQTQTHEVAHVPPPIVEMTTVTVNQQRSLYAFRSIGGWTKDVHVKY
jgi:hypothetical protein